MREYIEKSIVERMLWAVIMCKDERTIKEMLEDAPTVKAIPLDKVKQAREKISDWNVNEVMDGCSEPFKRGVAKGLDIASIILDKLIESEE